MEKNKLAVLFMNFFNSKWKNYIVNSVFILGLLSGLFTLYLLSSDLSSDQSEQIELFIKIDLLLLVLIVFFLIYRISTIFMSSQKKESGYGLQRKFASIFGVITVIPALIISFFSIVFFDLGIKSWFSDRVSSALQESKQVATAYLKEHQNTIVGDVQSIARDIDNRYKILDINQKKFEQNLALLGVLKNLTEMLVFDTKGKVYGRYGLTASLELQPISYEALARAKQGEVVILRHENLRRVRAIAKLNNFQDTYVIVGRFVDPKVIGYIQNTELAISQYETLEKNLSNLKVSFTLVFVLIVLLLLATSVWIGLSLATTLIQPVRKLMDATSDLGKGKLKIKLNPEEGYDEFGELIKSFNSMAESLDKSNKNLKKANSDILENSKFIETLLQGLTTGIIALSPNGKVLLMNYSAEKLLNKSLSDIKNKKFVNVVKEFSHIIVRALDTRKNQQEQVLIGDDLNKKRYLVRVGVEKQGSKIFGFIVAFEDISEIEKNQKNKAWADVARRVAHEIKNPLTPIQLSAERLKRKYKNKISDDVFENCTDTIITQVEEIGKLVDEFNSFARMPSAVMVEANLVETVKKSFTLQKTAHNFIKYTIKSPSKISYVHDIHQIGQLVTNLMKNAFVELSNSAITKPKIFVSLEVIKKSIILRIEDNGRGFPKNDREQLFEPYISNSKEGTGLGLSIVKKIVEDHQGTISLKDSELGGAMVEIVFKVKK